MFSEELIKTLQRDGFCLQPVPKRQTEYSPTDKSRLFGKIQQEFSNRSCY